jgi:hypothetical protein
MPSRCCNVRVSAGLLNSVVVGCSTGGSLCTLLGPGSMFVRLRSGSAEGTGRRGIWYDAAGIAGMLGIVVAETLGLAGLRPGLSGGETS